MGFCKGHHSGDVGDLYQGVAYGFNVDHLGGGGRGWEGGLVGRGAGGGERVSFSLKKRQRRYIRVGGIGCRGEGDSMWEVGKGGAS